MLPAVSALKKDTLGATYEHVNRLVKKESGDNFGNVEEFIKCNSQLNVFEKKVQAIVIDSLRIKEGVINGLLSDDVHLIRRVLKCDWFFKDAVPPEFYMNNIFPNVSFSTRCKIINKLSRNVVLEDHAEQLFHYIKKEYGRNYAEMLLPRCRSCFITDYFSNSKPYFMHNHSIKVLINICKRFPNLIPYFLENIFRDYEHNVQKYRKLILYMTKNYNFSHFFEKYHSELSLFRFGKKLTKTLATQLKTAVMSSYRQSLQGTFNTSVLFRSLTFDERVYFLQCLVHSNGVNLVVQNWLHTLPQMKPLIKLTAPSERKRLLETAFSKIYNQRLEDHPEVLTLDFLEMLPADDRFLYLDILQKMKEDVIMDLKLHERCEDNEREPHDIFPYLLTCKDAFPRLKALMIKMTTIKRREILLKEMIRNCVINEDSEGLETVLSYISAKHLNDDPLMIRRIMQILYSTNPKLFNVKVWNLMEQLATVLLLKSKDNPLFRGIIEDCIRFRIQNNLNVEKQVQNMVKLSFTPCPYALCLLVKVKAPFSRDIMNLYYNELLHVVKSDSIQEMERNILISFLKTINAYNLSVRKRERINIEDYSDLVEGIDKMMKTKGNSFEQSLLRHEVNVNKFLRNKYAMNLYENFFFPKSGKGFSGFNLTYIGNNLENVVNRYFVNDAFSLEKLCKTSRAWLDFMNFTPRMQEMTREKFKTSTKFNDKLNALKVYSYLGNIDDFMDLVSEYLPEKAVMEFDKNDKDFMDIQVTVPKLIKNVKPDSKNWPIIAKYLNADFLRWVLPSFSSASHNSPCKITLPTLMDYFPNKSMSVKKVILYRITDISSNDEKLKLFWELWETEKHSSVRTVVLRTIWKCFFESPRPNIYEMLKKCIAEANEIIMGEVPDYRRVPEEYMNDCICCLWKFSEKYENTRFAINFRNGIIQHFGPVNILILSDEFCEKVIRLYLFDSRSRIYVNDFCCYYLTSDVGSVKKKIILVLQLMKERSTNYAAVSEFLFHLRKSSVENPSRFVGIFEFILEEWPKIYNNVTMYRDYLYLEYARAYNTVVNVREGDTSVAAGFGKKLRSIICGVSQYNLLVDVFKETVDHFVGLLRSFDRVEMIDAFLGHSFGVTEAIIALKLVPSDAIEKYRKKPAGYCSGSFESTDQCLSVLLKLKEMNHDIIMIYLNELFGNELFMMNYDLS